MSGLEPLAIAGIAASAGGAALQATGSIMAGREQSQAAAYEQQQLNDQAENTRIAAAQDETRRREKLASSLETIQVMRGGRGVGADSPTGMAILDDATLHAERDINTGRLSSLEKESQDATGATMAGNRASTSLLAGYLGAGEAVASGIYRTASLSSGKYAVSSKGKG